MNNCFILKFFPFVFLLLIFTNSVLAQNRSRTALRSPCIENKDAKQLILNFVPFREPLKYFSGAGVFPAHNPSDVKRNYPVTYLFYQKGFYTMEGGGNEATSVELTSKGRELFSKYSEGVPLGSRTLVSVDGVVCTGKTAQVKVSFGVEPNQIARNLLGAAINNVEPFGRTRKHTFKLVNRNGRWQADKNEWVGYAPYVIN